jgi:hypothetical protein
LERVIRPEDLAPRVGSVVSLAQLSERFGIEDLKPRSGRFGGHLFIFVERKKVLLEPDRLRFAVEKPRPAETAFVLSKMRDGAWRYLGVAHRTGDESVWQIPALDFATWKQWGEGREVSRRLPETAVAGAEKVVNELLSLPAQQRWVIQSNGRRGRVVGRARQGGLRLDGGKGGFAERTVSLLDIAWVFAAREDVQAHGGLLDEERVNRLRYLEGTPKASTRWVDTGWALACVAGSKS